MKKQWQLLRSIKKQNLRLFDARFDHLINPRNDKEIEVVVLTGASAVNVVALTTNATFLFIRQYRFGVNEYTVEIPGGLLDEGENTLTAVQRELQEETGYGGGTWEYLGKINQNPVFQDNYIHHYLATGVELMHNTNFDDAEDIEIVEMTLEEVKEGIQKLAFQHPHTVSALVLALNKLK